MNAIILAAGFGTRLKPFTDTNPKALVPLNGIPLIFYTLAFLKKHGIREIAINLHHHGEKIASALGDGGQLGLHIRYSREKEILGTGGGIKKALTLLTGNDVLIVNGDVILDFDLEGLIRHHKKNKFYATFLLSSQLDTEKYGAIHFKDGRIVSILNQPPPNPAASAGVYASCHILSKNLSAKKFAGFPYGKMFCLMHEVLIPELLAGKKFGALVTRGFVHICDSAGDIKNLEILLAEGKIRLSYAREVTGNRKEG